MGFETCMKYDQELSFFLSILGFPKMCASPFEFVEVEDVDSNSTEDILTESKESPHVIKFTKTTSIKNHEMIHTGEKQFVCEYCDKKFITNIKLKRHEQTHMNKKKNKKKDKNERFPCYICGADFARMDIFQKHFSTIHERKKPYECHICNSSFSQKHHM